MPRKGTACSARRAGTGPARGARACDARARDARAQAQHATCGNGTRVTGTERDAPAWNATCGNGTRRTGTARDVRARHATRGQISHARTDSRSRGAQGAPRSTPDPQKLERAARRSALRIIHMNSAWRAGRAARTQQSVDAPPGGVTTITNQAGRRSAPPIAACMYIVHLPSGI